MVVNMRGVCFLNPAKNLCATRSRGVAIAVALAALVGGVAACGSGTSTGTPQRRIPAITVQQRGGIAGVSNTLRVRPTGAWTATSRASGERSGQLNAAQFATVAVLAADPRLASEAARPSAPTRCRDAFDYTVTVGSVRISYTDCPADGDLPDAAVALVRELRADTS